MIYDSLCHAMVDVKEATANTFEGSSGPKGDTQEDDASTIGGTSEDASSPHNPETLERRASGLQRIEQQISMILDRINNLPQTTQSSPDNVKKGPAPLIIDSNPALLQDFRPSTPSIVDSLGSDLETDLRLWNRGNNTQAKNRDSALPPLPPEGIHTSANMADAPADIVGSQKGPNPELHVHINTKQSVLASSSEASSGYIRNERQDAAMRLDGSHPDLMHLRMNSKSSRFQGAGTGLASKWSPDSRSLAEQSRMQSKASAPLPPRKDRVLSAYIEATSLHDDKNSVGTTTSPPTPTQRDFRHAATVKREPSIHREETLVLLRNIQDLLTSLVGAQEKTEKSLEHQQSVSVYLKDLNSFLAQDRDSRQQEFKTSKLCYLSDTLRHRLIASNSC
jgi:hypothetical protein